MTGFFSRSLGWAALDLNDVLQILPHRYPLLRVARIIGMAGDILHLEAELKFALVQQ